MPEPAPSAIATVGNTEQANHFSDLLASVREQLKLPEPTRSRILLEIANDLEELFLHHRSAGLSAARARERVEQAMELSTTVLAEIVKVHASPYQRFLDHLSSRARARWERGALLALGLAVCLIVLSVAAVGPVFVQARPFIWPVLACFLGAAILAIQRTHALFLKGTGDAKHARKKLGLLLALGVAQPAIGLAGAWFGLIPVSWAMIEAEVMPSYAIFNWMIGAAALMLISIAGAILIAIWWLILAGRAAAIEEAAVDAMGAVTAATEDNEENL
jgi:hypothetical protein